MSDISRLMKELKRQMEAPVTKAGTKAGSPELNRPLRTIKQAKADIAKAQS